MSDPASETPFRLPLPERPCTPPWWAGNGHLQTLLAHFLPSPRFRGRLKDEHVALPDGDRLRVHTSEGESGVVVYLFHGLGGSVEADYMQRSARIFHGQGHGVWMVNHRGAGAGRGLAARPYHSGSKADVAAVLAEGRRRRPDAVHVAVGFSLSASCVLLDAADPELAKPDLAVAVNPPVHLERSARVLHEGLNRLYDLRFVWRCRRLVRERVEDGLLEDRWRIPVFSTLHDFDDLFTAPAGGFANREDYYARCSSKDHLGRIRIPTVLLTAADDPVIPADDLARAEKSPLVHVHVEPTGGHMGYLCDGPTPLGSRRWLDYALDHYVREGLAWLAATGRIGSEGALSARTRRTHGAPEPVPA